MKTIPTALGGKPKYQAIIAVVILAIIRQVTAFVKCRIGLTDSVSINFATFQLSK